LLRAIVARAANRRPHPARRDPNSQRCRRTGAAVNTMFQSYALFPQ